MASQVEASKNLTALSELGVVPVGNRYLIEIPEEEERVGSIYLPPSSDRNRRTCRGFVRGISVFIEKPVFKVGDQVIFGRWSGTEVTINRKKFLLMPEPEIQGMIVRPVDIQIEDEDI